MTSLQKTLIDFIQSYPDISRLWVAASGGLDSCVLLHLLSQANLDCPIKVLHVNHRLSPNADQWHTHCENLANEYGFDFVAETVTVLERGGGLEKAARDARYTAFQRHIERGDMLLTAHHCDDQAETLLLRLVRGTGLRGLGGIAPVRSLAKGLLGRPLLAHSRAELHRYAQSHKLHWMEDESNQSQNFDRNFVRLNILPVIGQRWPGFAERWAQTAKLARQNEALLREYAADDLKAADRRLERLGQSISLHYLSCISEARANALIRYWVEDCGYQAPERVHLESIAESMSAGQDAQPIVGWGDCELRRFAERLYLLPRLPSVTLKDTSWQPEQRLHLSDGSELSADKGQSGLRADCDYQIGFRQGGERCQPHDRAHSQKLKKLLQEYQLEPWLRDRVPLIYAGDQLAAVGDLWVCRGFYADKAPAWRVVWGFGSGD